MGTIIAGGAVALLCSNLTMVKIVSSVGVIMCICKIKVGRDIAVGSGLIYIISNIVKGVF